MSLKYITPKDLTKYRQIKPDAEQPLFCDGIIGTNKFFTIEQNPGEIYTSTMTPQEIVNSIITYAGQKGLTSNCDEYHAHYPRNEDVYGICQKIFFQQRGVNMIFLKTDQRKKHFFCTDNHTNTPCVVNMIQDYEISHEELDILPIKNQPSNVPAIIEVLRKDVDDYWRLRCLLVLDPILRYHIEFGIFKTWEWLSSIIIATETWDKKRFSFNKDSTRKEAIRDKCITLAAQSVEVCFKSGYTGPQGKHSKYLLLRSLLKAPVYDYDERPLIDALRDTKTRFSTKHNPYDWILNILKQLKNNDPYKQDWPKNIPRKRARSNTASRLRYRYGGVA